jgi:hypothetical protein
LQLNNKHKDSENLRIEGIASSRLKIKFPLQQELPLLKKTVILRQCKIGSIQIISNSQAIPKAKHNRYQDRYFLNLKEIID